MTIDTNHTPDPDQTDNHRVPSDTAIGTTGGTHGGADVLPFPARDATDAPMIPAPADPSPGEHRNTLAEVTPTPTGPTGVTGLTDAGAGPHPGTEIEPATEVFDAEIVDDDGEALGPVDPAPGPAGDPRPLPERLAAREATRQPVLAPWLRSREELAAVARWTVRHVGHTAAYHAARSPLYAGRLAARSPRGAVRVMAGTWGWVFDREGAPLRLDAVAKGDADLYLKLVQARRDRVRTRLLVTLLGATVAAAGVLVILGLAPALAQDAALAGLLAALGWAGRHRDRPIVGRAVITTKAQRLTSDIVVRALGALGNAEINKAVGKNGSGITFPAPIVRDGPGWRAEVDLPYGVTAVDVMEDRDRLASGLRRPVGCVWPEPVHDQHAGRLVLWVGDTDMARAKPKPWPLARRGQASIFGDLPVGTDPRGRTVSIQLIFNSMLIGAMPRQGKTFQMRLVLLAAALDPIVQMRVFELKGTGDLSCMEKVAYHYGSGVDDDTIESAVSSLRQLVTEELPRRAARIKSLPKELCPENKVTPELSANKRLGLHPIVMGIDECQELFTHSDFGKEAAELCTRLIKLGPALGIMLVLATQRPDKDSLPTGVSANVGIRFCLRVMGQTENDMVLGTSSYKNGVRATMFTSKDKGIGYLVGAGDDAQITRGSYVDGPGADTIADRARGLRDQAGTLAGHAIGEQDTNPAARRRSILDDVLGVFEAGEDKLWSETIVARLAEADPVNYKGFTANALAAAFKPYGVVPGQVPMRIDGADRNKRGYRAEVLRDARDKTQKVDGE